jgi:ribosomal protein S18 acetylase RimI-like enzyme
VSWRDIGPLAAVLAEAFRNDPLYRWMFGGDEEWLLHGRQFFRLLLRVHSRDGEAYTTEDRAGASLWTIPDLPYGGPFTQLILPLQMRRMFGSRTDTVRRQIGQLNAARPTQAHYYLPVLGVDPERQRSGIGTALLRPVMSVCDSAGYLIYLETSVADNLRFYRRLGFEVEDELAVDGGPEVWGMLREPGAS